MVLELDYTDLEMQLEMDMRGSAGGAVRVESDADLGLDGGDDESDCEERWYDDDGDGEADGGGRRRDGPR